VAWALALAAGTASAALPEVVDRVPSTAQVVVSVTNAEAFMDQIGGLARVFGGDLAGEDGPLEMLNVITSLEGLNKGGAVVAVVMPGAAEGQEVPNMVLMVPVSDYRAFVTGLKGDAAAGVATIEMDGEPAFARDIGGGYALIGPIQELVQTFPEVKGQKAAHMARAGAKGRAIVEASDLVVLADVQSLKPMLDEALEGLPTPADLMGGMGGGPEADDAAKQMDMMKQVAQNFTRDGEAGVMGVSLAGGNVVIHLGAQFKKGSELGGFFAGGGDSTPLLAKLPATPFLMAFAMDSSSPGLRTVMRNMQGMNAQGGAMGKLNEALLGISEGSEGGATVLGYNPMALMGGGLFINTTSFTATKDTAALLKRTQEAMAAMNGVESPEGKVETTFAAGAVEVSGVKADKQTLKLIPGPDADPMAGQALAMMLGPTQELTMLSAPVDGGVVTVMSNNPPLMTTALEAAKSGKGLGEDKGIATTRALLPGSRVMEAYIGTGSIMESVGPFLAMMGGPEDLDLPTNLAPIGMAMASGEEGMSFTIAIPADNIKMFSDLAKAMQQLQGGGEEPVPADNDGGNAPAF
jgi:hypothetical protein